MAISKISSAMDILRSSIYYCDIERSVKRKLRVFRSIETKINGISGGITTYGYKRTWELLRNSSIYVKMKTGRRIMRKNDLTLPYAKHKTRTKRKDLAKLETSKGYGILKLIFIAFDSALSQL